MTGVEFSEVTVNRGAFEGDRAAGDQELCHEDELANHSPRTGFLRKILKGLILYLAILSWIRKRKRLSLLYRL